MLTTNSPESACWQFLAPCWDRAKSNRCSLVEEYEANVCGNSCPGLCSSVFYLPVLQSIKDKMESRLKKYKLENKIKGWYFFPLDIYGAKLRADLCRAFAAEAEAEERGG